MSAHAGRVRAAAMLRLRTRRSDWACQRRSSSTMAAGEAYALLGVRPGASAADIKAAYRRLALRHHPDVAGPGDADLFKRITSAYSQALLEAAQGAGGAGAAASAGAAGDSRRARAGESARRTARPRGPSDNFDHAEWDAAHYGAEREARQSAYARERAGAQGGGAGVGSEGRSMGSVLLYAGALYVVYHLVYSTHFGWLREEAHLLEAKHMADAERRRRASSGNG
ncbi:heat shock protein-like protein DnaJ [Emiliania huxleyi CCMP1516]|uniref:J domain-containing protein n=2 Tax=Emiliania huxleyi TaxID=2903 RepID=A0A0D3JXW3_EMIH1|nr:heat shock protein-like protein DnaJ [Emiliania huxleyi CCMP1516]EOD28348.1 heat shock protein-like protein DnaJ [Emiliania huxleyi CCMP1516]|eukprot:XP_005780777.1 heat shock protein-like protein DnaJ [Emiliania huxleyi CCMP1516]